MLSGGPLEALCWVGGKWAGLGASTEAGESGSVGLVLGFWLLRGSGVLG